MHGHWESLQGAQLDAGVHLFPPLWEIWPQLPTSSSVSSASYGAYPADLVTATLPCSTTDITTWYSASSDRHQGDGLILYFLTYICMCNINNIRVILTTWPRVWTLTTACFSVLPEFCCMILLTRCPAALIAAGVAGDVVSFASTSLMMVSRPVGDSVPGS